MSFIDLVSSQYAVFNVITYWPCFIICFIAILAEINRIPFDLPEAESELVSGYNVEYSAISFVFFFLAEYSNLLLMSFVLVFFFFGGWLSPFSFFNDGFF